VLGVTSYLLSCLLAVSTVAFGMTAFHPGMNVLANAAICVGLLLGSLMMWSAAEMFFVPSVREALSRDGRPPVMYLRPFGEDKSLVYDVISSGETTTELSAKAEDFLLPLNAVGPLVSIAKPNWLARLGMHPHGAYRDFIGIGDWQARVRELIDQAGMVVLAIGDSPGIEWEIAQVRERIGPESLLLYLPPRPVDSLTRKGRSRKERAIYEQFKPLIEKYFELEMPPFSEATYIIGFESSGKPVLPDAAPHSRWSFSQYGRVKKAIHAQLDEVLKKVRPGVDLHHYKLLGRPGLWVRLVSAVALALVFGLVIGAHRLDGVLAIIWQFIPDLLLIAGWVLLAHRFARRWVWSIPLLLALGLVMHAAHLFWFLGYAAQATDRLKFWTNLYSVVSQLVYLVYAAAVLALGLVLPSRRSAKSDEPPGVP